jgi:hypothetical protein
MSTCTFIATALPNAILSVQEPKSTLTLKARDYSSDRVAFPGSAVEVRGLRVLALGREEEEVVVPSLQAEELGEFTHFAVVVGLSSSVHGCSSREEK